MATLVRTGLGLALLTAILTCQFRSFVDRQLIVIPFATPVVSLEEVWMVRFLWYLTFVILHLMIEDELYFYRTY